MIKKNTECETKLNFRILFFAVVAFVICSIGADVRQSTASATDTKPFFRASPATEGSSPLATVVKASRAAIRASLRLMAGRSPSFMRFCTVLPFASINRRNMTIQERTPRSVILSPKVPGKVASSPMMLSHVSKRPVAGPFFFRVANGVGKIAFYGYFRRRAYSHFHICRGESPDKAGLSASII